MKIEKVLPNQQKDINERLKEICQGLKSIRNIGLNYVGYTSALIYIIAKNGKNFEYILKDNSDNMKFLLDDYLSKIREEEQSERLFKNIKFSEVINNNYEIFVDVMKELSILSELLRRQPNGKTMLANAFENMIIEAAKYNGMSRKSKEFYTPKEIVITMVKLLEIKDNMTIYDPACGTGSFFVESSKYGNIVAYGQEQDIENYNICMTNLFLHDIDNKKILENNENLKDVDIAITNPPFVDNSTVRTNYENISSYTRYLISMIESVNKYGKVEIVLPNAFLFKNTKAERYVREMLIKENYIDSIISLPENLFYTTRIPVVILLINKARPETKKDILFIDASREYSSKRGTNLLTEENQKKIVETYKKYESIPNYSNVVSIEKIKENNYDLTIKKYVKYKSVIKTINQKEIEENIHSLEEQVKEIQKQITDVIKDIKNN